jgi:steroid 5-alpha reductase family enzyme
MTQVLTVVFLALFGVSMASSLAEPLVVNGLAQLVLFLVVAVAPFLRTGRMSYVDLAWPFGVAAIGIVALVVGDGAVIRRIALVAVYLFIGLRMGIAALWMAVQTGVIRRHEFPRYRYRRMLAERDHPRRAELHLLNEIVLQGLANATVLAVPAMIMATNPSGSVSAPEIVGLALWLFGYATESTADAQKLAFARRAGENDVCDVGLWRFSRHPNYFGEWLVWTGVAVAAVPSWLALGDLEPTMVWGALGLSCLLVPVVLYMTLVLITGAVPAEYYSVRKRPDYRRYQETTSRFFLWPPKSAREDRGTNRRPDRAE